MELASLLESVSGPLTGPERNDLVQKLEQQLTYLINNDFNRLVQLLYTIDIDEKNLKSLLLQRPQKDAAQLMAAMIVTRQEEKVRARQQFKNTRAMNDDEPW